MSAATDMLEAGAVVLSIYHGDSLTWLPASVVAKRENGEVIINESGKAMVSDDSGAVSFTGIFDEAHAVINAADGSIASTGPAVLDVKPSSVPGYGRGGLVIRGGVQYYVVDVQSDGNVGRLTFILSKHAH